MGTLVIVNPDSGRGCAPTVFKKIEKRLFDVFGELFVAVAHGPHEVAEHLDQAAKADVNRLITLGGVTEPIILCSMLWRSGLK